MQDDTETIKQLQVELTQLRQRVTEQEQEHTAMQGLIDEQAQQLEMLQSIVHHSSAIIYVKDLEGTILSVNKPWSTLFNVSPDQVVGSHEHAVLPTDVLAASRTISHQVVESHAVLECEETLSLDDKVYHYTSTQFPIHNTEGTVYAIGNILTDITQSQRIEHQFRESQALLGGILDNLPVGFFVKDLEGRFLLINNLIASMLDISPEQMVGKLDSELYPPEVVAEWRERNMAAVNARKPVEAEEVFPLENGLHTFLSINFPISDAEGNIYATGTIIMDITERKQAEEERDTLQQQMIEAQQLALRELSTPLMPIAEGVLAMPLIGNIDSGRAQMVMETLLQGIAEHVADIAILDITGVQMVDTQVANALIQTAHAVRLLGAEVVLTGIQPHIAQTLVNLGVDLSGIVTRNSLRSGIAYALAKEENAVEIHNLSNIEISTHTKE